MVKSTETEVEVKVEEKVKGRCCSKGHCCGLKNASCGGVYCVGALGAVIYFVSTATSFLGGVLGLLKAVVWPAFAVYGLLGFLGL